MEHYGHINSIRRAGPGVLCMLEGEAWGDRKVEATLFLMAADARAFARDLLYYADSSDALMGDSSISLMPDADLEELGLIDDPMIIPVPKIAEGGMP